MIQYNYPRGLFLEYNAFTIDHSRVCQLQEYELFVWKMHYKMSFGESSAILPRVLWSKEISFHPYNTKLTE